MIELSLKRTSALACAWIGLTGCGPLLDLDNFAPGARNEDAAAPRECTTHRDCNPPGAAAAICREPDGACVPLASPDCQVVTGEYSAPGAIVLGSMFALSGAQATTSAARQSSAALAIEQINAQGGVPRGRTSADMRPLVLVGCDVSQDLRRAGRHLIDELGVPAIVGPSASQDVLDLSRELSVPGGTVVITPTALASSIADLLDDGLTWQMVPTDIQRGPLMVLQLEQMQAQLRRERQLDKVKLLVVFRDDALGAGTRESLNELELNGLPLTDADNLGRQLLIDAYDVTAPSHTERVQQDAAFAPDIVVLAGTAEMVTDVMLPLEAAWPAGKLRPLYLAIDGVKVNELLQATARNDDLRRRIRGTGVIPSPRASSVYDAFRFAFQTRFPAIQPTMSGIGPTYDATYALGLAIAATFDQPLTGRSIADGLSKLWGGPAEIELRETQVLAAFSKLVMRDEISALGTFGPLAWARNGAVLGGTLEMWCIGREGDTLRYEGSGLTLALESGLLQGDYVQCP